MNQRRLTDAMQNALVLGFPILISGDIMLEIQKGSLFLVIQYLFAVWLSLYFLYILFWEYYLFSELHALKSPPMDGLLLIGIFLSVRQFSHAGENVPASLAWMCLGLVWTIIWECYTILVGREKYFNASADSLKPLPMAQNFMNSLLYKSKKQQSVHWDEYRYWLMLDLVLLVPASVSVVLCKRIQSPELNRQIQWSLLSLCFGLCIFNIYRYKLMRASVAKSRKSSD